MFEVPNIFLCSNRLGGSDDTVNAFKDGSLEAKLKECNKEPWSEEEGKALGEDSKLNIHIHAYDKIMITSNKISLCNKNQNQIRFQADIQPQESIMQSSHNR